MGGNLHCVEVEYGGISKRELLDRLGAASIGLNEYALKLLNSELFEVRGTREKAIIADLRIEELGFPGGATLPELFEAAEERGFSPCPLEAGPFYRLAYLDQEEEHEEGRNKAPKGSITLLSPLLDAADEDFPKGFYLRKIEGRLWLRGYVCPLDYRWDKGDRIALALRP
jgi:hypothetical protein